MRGRLSASTKISIERFSRARVDIAEPDLGDLGMVHFVLERGVEPFALDRDFDQRFALGDGGDGCVGILQRILDAVIDRGNQPAHSRGIVLGELLRDDDGVGIEVHAVIAVIDEAELLVRVDADQLGGKADGVDVTEGAVDLALHQHLLAQVRLHVGDGDFACSRSW